MFGRKARPVINNLITGASGSSGYKPDVVSSPRSPLDFIKIQSPTVFNNYGGGGGAVGVGLGIVAALEKSMETRSALYNKCCSVKNRGNTTEEENDGDILEDYTTYVTSYGPNKKSHTRVYYDDACENQRMCVFHICPETSSSTLKSSDFLTSCDMCRKKLHGEDIYMYRGEKAYCSTECRERQIVMDEEKENKWVASSTSAIAHLSTSPCTTHDRQMLIFAI